MATAFLVATATGCGDDNSERERPPSAYCDEAREWAIHEMEPFDESDPAAFPVLGVLRRLRDGRSRHSTDEIKDDWVLKVESKHALMRFSRSTSTRGCDMEQGTAEEQAAFPRPCKPANRVLIYEANVSGTSTPPRTLYDHRPM